ncbi:hypothetical protein GPL06_14235 [Bacteroides salyersiae]|uniref:RDD family protein n=1 Tax=Bacteroides salyersiae TaxID=291644 RepID=UPI001C0258BA|nr:RDD family protein [Bacteroides salyersiae]MBT9873952.1 hypothetical protein [Bacteroides salyersiae]
MKLKRVIAFVIDLFIASVICFIVILFLKKCNVRITSYIVSSIVYVLILCKDCYNGLSIGRRITNIQVFDSKTMKVASPVKCVLRNYFYALHLLEVFFVLFTSSGLRIGDRITGTKVAERNMNLKEVDIRKIVLAVSEVIAIILLMGVIIYIRASSLGRMDLWYE